MCQKKDVLAQRSAVLSVVSRLDVIRQPCQTQECERRSAKGEGSQSSPGIRTAFVRRACRNRAIGLPKPGVSSGRSGSWRNRFPTFCVFCPVFRRKPECFCRKRGVFHHYFPTALFFSSIIGVIVCTIGDSLFDCVCNLFESTIRFV